MGTKEKVVLIYRNGWYKMVFSSVFFLFCFLPLLLGIYFLAKDKYRNYVLLVFSLIF